VRDFEQVSLLRVDLLGLARAHAESRRVEAPDVVDQAGGEGVAAAPLVGRRMVEGLGRETVARDPADAGAVVAQQRPKGLGVGGAGQAAGVADDGNFVPIRHDRHAPTTTRRPLRQQGASGIVAQMEGEITERPAIPGGAPNPWPRRIVLCHLDSLVGLPALNTLFERFGDRIGLVISSNRFAGAQHGVASQFFDGLKRSGLRLTFWLGFDIIAAQVVGAISRLLAPLVGRQRQLSGLRALARRHDARFLEVADINGADVAAAVRDYEPDIVLVMNFDQILREAFIALPRFGVINIHPSMLPALRGPCPAFWALSEGRDGTGVSVHAIEDRQIDAGRILAQERVDVSSSDSVGELTTDLFVAGVQLLPKAFEALATNPRAGQPPDLALGSYCGFPDRAAMAMASQRGVRLCRLGHAVRLIAASLGVWRWRRAA
jgi:folate-dependent phosphoribosylglycinamide formyltransferase PurN